MRRPGPRRRALRGIPPGSPPSACCRTGGSPRVLMTTRSGCGMRRPGQTARLEGHSAAVAALCLLKDGRLASGSLDNTIRLWDAATGAETGRLEGHSGGVAALCLLKDGRLASGSWTTRSGCGMRRPGPRRRASRGIQPGWPPSACCRTGGSPRAPLGQHDPAVGCGDWGRDGAPRGAFSRGRRPLPAAGRAARLRLLLGQHDPAVGCGGRGRDGAPRGAFRRGLRPLPAAGRAARLRLLLGQHDPAVGCGDRGRDGAPRGAFRRGRRPLPAAGRAARLGCL